MVLDGVKVLVECESAGVVVVDEDVGNTVGSIFLIFNSSIRLSISLDFGSFVSEVVLDGSFPRLRVFCCLLKRITP